MFYILSTLNCELNKGFLTQSVDLIERFLHDLRQTELMENCHRFISYFHKEDHEIEYVFDYFKEEVDYCVGSLSDLRRSIEQFKTFLIDLRFLVFIEKVDDDQVGESEDDEFQFILSEPESREVEMEGISSDDYDYET
ncbi:hypothetical protein GEMRC1_000808 [Eukaryota sp. GEM-RC1]